MKLGVSNLGWAPDADRLAQKMFPALGILGIEVAPTRIADWGNLTPTVLSEFLLGWNDVGIQICSLQAIFFNKPEARLLESADAFDAMAEHMRGVADIAQSLGASVAVFGAPRARIRGDLNPIQAEMLAVERFHILGDIAGNAGLSICIEPVPECYGADFLTHAADVLRFVKRCDHPSIRPHLDIACVTLAGDDIAQEIESMGDRLAHYHISEPDLSDFEQPQCPHQAAAKALCDINYQGWRVIEMRQNKGDGLAAIKAAIEYCKRYYNF